MRFSGASKRGRVRHGEAEVNQFDVVLLVDEPKKVAGELMS